MNYMFKIIHNNIIFIYFISNYLLISLGKLGISCFEIFGFDNYLPNYKFSSFKLFYYNIVSIIIIEKSNYARKQQNDSIQKQ